MTLFQPESNVSTNFRILTISPQYTLRMGGDTKVGLYRITNRPDETRPNVLGSVEYRLKKNVCMRWPWYFMTWPSSEVWQEVILLMN